MTTTFFSRAARRLVGCQQNRLEPASAGNAEGWLILYHGVRVTAGGMSLSTGTRVARLGRSRRVFAAATNGFLPPRCPTNVTATSTASCFLAAGFWTSPAARFVFTTAAPTRAWHWPRRGFRTCSVTSVRALRLKPTRVGPAGRQPVNSPDAAKKVVAFAHTLRQEPNHRNDFIQIKASSNMTAAKYIGGPAHPDRPVDSETPERLTFAATTILTARFAAASSSILRTTCKARGIARACT